MKIPSKIYIRKVYLESLAEKDINKQLRRNNYGMVSLWSLRGRVYI